MTILEPCCKNTQFENLLKSLSFSKKEYFMHYGDVSFIDWLHSFILYFRKSFDVTIYMPHINLAVIIYLLNSLKKSHSAAAARIDINSISIVCTKRSMKYIQHKLNPLGIVEEMQSRNLLSFAHCEKSDELPYISFKEHPSSSHTPTNTPSIPSSLTTYKFSGLFDQPEQNVKRTFTVTAITTSECTSEECPSEESTSEDTTSEESTSEESASEESPSEDTPSEESHSDDIPSEASPSDDPSGNTPSEESSSNSLPSDDSPSEVTLSPEDPSSELPS